MDRVPLDLRLPIPDGHPRPLAIGWLLLGLAAMGVSALFAVVLVLLRTPYLRQLVSGPDLFPIALVLHVDFAVLIWFLSLAGALWSLLGSRGLRRTGWLALGLAAAGAAAMVLAVLTAHGIPRLSNYLPVLDGPVFLLGLGLFVAGCAVMAIRTLTGNGAGARVLCVAARCAALAVAAALLVTVFAYLRMPDGLHGLDFFEVLFWGGGHVLQFAHTLLMVVAWLCLADAAGARLQVRPSLLAALFMLTLVPVLLAPLFPFLFEVGSAAYRSAFTRLMTWASWPAALVIGALVLRALHRARPRSDFPAKVFVGLSALLFVGGLAAGALIRSDNVMVTAHYHGTVGAVTLAYMGLSFHLLGRLGFGTIPAAAMRLQAMLYGAGMVSLVAGLAWSGFQGVQRKTAGAAQALENVQELAGMLLMGAGGLVALLATWLFLALAVRALRPARQPLAEPETVE